jgi:uncharacterized membrane protein
MTPPATWTPLIISHALCAVLALLLGAAVLFRRKGTPSHRLLGRVWVGLMAVVALSSFGIFSDGYSWIHGLSVFTLVMLVVGVRLARQGKRVAHRITMQSIYGGALVLTGLFTLLPNRLIGKALVEMLGLG